MQTITLDDLDAVSGGTDWARIRRNAGAGAIFGAGLGGTFAAGMLVGGPVGAGAAALTVGAFTAGGAIVSGAADFLVQRTERQQP